MCLRVCQFLKKKKKRDRKKKSKKKEVKVESPTFPVHLNTMKWQDQQFLQKLIPITLSSTPFMLHQQAYVALCPSHI